jgi:hypothetical protein
MEELIVRCHRCGEEEVFLADEYDLGRSIPVDFSDEFDADIFQIGPENLHECQTCIRANLVDPYEDDSWLEQAFEDGISGGADW